jgi:hypothetical protein
MLHLKLLDKQEKAKFQTSRRRDIIKIRFKHNKIETKKQDTDSMKLKLGSSKR